MLLQSIEHFTIAYLTIFLCQLREFDAHQCDQRSGEGGDASAQEGPLDEFPC